MNEVRVVEGLTRDRVKAARKRLRESVRAGETPTIEDMVASRGLTIASRENSIFSDAWVPLAVIFVIVGFLLDRYVPCMALGLMLIAIVLAGRWWRNQALEGIVFERAFDHTHVFPNEPIKMRMTITNHKRLPLTWLQFRDMIDGPVKISSDYRPPIDSLEQIGLVSSFAIRGNEILDRTVTLNFRYRGFYTVGPVTYQSGDIFTLFTTERDYDYRHVLVVYPNIWPLDSLGLPAKEPFGDLRVRRSLFTDPIKTMGIRDYQPQDRFRDIHWKATARRNDLQTKVYDPSTGMTTVLFLNVATDVVFWRGHEPELLERLIAVTASIANFGHEQSWSVGVYANGSVPRSDQPIRVRPGRSPNQLMYVLEALAAVTGYATGPIERLMQRESTRLPWASTFVLVTAVVTPEIMVVLSYLREAGRRVVLISLADEPPNGYLDGITTYHIPVNAPAFQGRPSPDSQTAMALDAISLAQHEVTKAIQGEDLQTIKQGYFQNDVLRQLKIKKEQKASLEGSE